MIPDAWQVLKHSKETEIGKKADFFAEYLQYSGLDN